MRLFSILFILLFSCNLSGLDTKKTGLHKVSQSVNESKENRVFLYSLEPNKHRVNIGNNQIDTIQEVWVENSWQYQNQGSEAIVQRDSSQQLAIRFRTLPKDKADVWIKQGNSLLGWNGVATGNYQINSLFYVVRDSVGKETILDSFVLRR